MYRGSSSVHSAYTYSFMASLVVPIGYVTLKSLLTLVPSLRSARAKYYLGGTNVNRLFRVTIHMVYGSGRGFMASVVSTPYRGLHSTFPGLLLTFPTTTYPGFRNEMSIVYVNPG